MNANERESEEVRNLSPAQRCVLVGLAQGKKPNVIAGEMPEALRVSERGVRWHREQIYRKLGIHSVIEATQIAMRAGLLL